MTHRIAALDKDLCQPKKCGLECIKYCPVNKSGADCIILNEETKNLIAKDQFIQMKQECILINTARGGIVNEQDLVWALENKKIYAAGLDVFETEPPARNNPLFQFDNVLLTPHNSALTLECRKRMAVETAENIAYYLEDQSKLNIQNIINQKNLNL